MVPTDLFGLPADVGAVRRACPDPKVAILEDAAQALGARRNGGEGALTADALILSLGRGKAFSTVSGGVVLTNRRDLADRLEARTSQAQAPGRRRTVVLFAQALVIGLFARPNLFWLPRSLPFLKLGETVFEPHFPLGPFSAFQAGLARGWRSRLAAFQRARAENSKTWAAALRRFPGTLPRVREEDYPNLIRFPWMIASPQCRDGLLRESDRLGLGIMPAYPRPIHEIPEIRHRFAGESYPRAEALSRGLVTLPTHPYLSSRDRRRISALLAEAVERSEPGVRAERQIP